MPPTLFFVFHTKNNIFRKLFLTFSNLFSFELFETNTKQTKNNRFKKTETTLRDIVSSFRCYGDGVNFSAEIAKNDSRFDLDKSL